jgi:hypothetical protein
MRQIQSCTRLFVLASRTIAIGLVGALALASVSDAQTKGGPGAQLADLQKDWREQKDLLVSLADAMPAEKFDYRPTPAQRTYGEQILHIALGNVASMRSLGTTRKPPFSLQPNPANRTAEEAFKGATKQEVIRMLSDAYDFGTAVLAEQTPDSINALVDRNVSSYFGGSTRARVVWSLLSHASDIYGQMVVYVRLNGIVPPASRGI